MSETNDGGAILVHYGEIGLKGKNRPDFLRKLRLNIEQVLRHAGLDWPAETRMGHFWISVPPNNSTSIDAAVKLLQSVFGIAWLAVIRQAAHQGFKPGEEEEDFQKLSRALIALAREKSGDGKTFCVRVRRSDKRLPFTSDAMAAKLGAELIRETDWKRVNLTKPDVTFQLEVHRRWSYLFSERVKGPGGLPVGCAGRVLVLLSGGIDSPVAAYLMAKRGCHVDFIHFTATSLQQDEAENYKVWRLAEMLTRYTLRSRLFLVPYTYFDVALFGHEVIYDLILFRRFMARTAEALAVRLGAEALVTGDNLSQVASQTLSNLVATSQSATMPILRPLLCFDKNEIIDLAERIGTYAASIEPYKDCCALITRQPRTRSEHETLSRIETSVLKEPKKLIDQTLGDAICLEAEFGARKKA